MSLNTPVINLSKIAFGLRRQFKKIEIKTINDLLFYFPYRYEDLQNLTPIAKLKIGESVTIRARVDIVESKKSKYKRANITEAILSDSSGKIKSVWFNQPFIARTIKPGDEIIVSGKINFGIDGPQIQPENLEKLSVITKRGSYLLGIYSVTHGLTSKQLRFLIELALKNSISDWMPEKIKTELRLPDLGLALYQIHFPKNEKYLNWAKWRLKFDELFLIALKNEFTKKELKSKKANPINFWENETKNFVRKLPFTLTDDQKKVSWKILGDLKKGSPMNRLLDGDVGSGKTIVAAIAILNVLLGGRQVCYMAPTEILARQQFESFCGLFKDFSFKIALLSRGEKRIKNSQKTTKKNLISQIESGEIKFVIGTHALLSESVNFFSLALVVVDEQHRFGVEQRKKINQKAKNSSPHFLSMTATPIPRTMRLALYGDLDISVIEQMPKNRKSIITKLIREKNRAFCYQFTQEKIKEGRQVFVICPLIDPSDKLGVKSVSEEYKKLAKEIFPQFKIAMIHGKLKGAEKEKVMSDFLAGKIDILVATSVVEVGIDIPNASIMLIEGAERFGLAQLHQFRGRVGRGAHQSHCFLLPTSLNDISRERLEAVEKINSGFLLAKKDLELRGPGEVFGARQSGLPNLKIAELTDYSIIARAREEARKLLNQDATLSSWPSLYEKMLELNQKVHLE